MAGGTNVNIRIENIPVAQISFLIILNSVVFNVGFFYVAGLQFIGLFSSQEHAVFALTSLSSALFIFNISYSFAYPFIVNNHDPIVFFNFNSKTNIRNALILVSGPLMTGVMFVFFNRGNWGWKLVLLMALTTILSMSTVVLFKLYFQSHTRRALYWAVFSSMGLVLALGMFSASRTLYDIGYMNSNRAIMPDGSLVSTVRIASSFSLVTTDGHAVEAVKTELLSHISTNWAPKLSPGAH